MNKAAGLFVETDVGVVPTGEGHEGGENEDDGNHESGGWLLVGRCVVGTP